MTLSNDKAHEVQPTGSYEGYSEKDYTVDQKLDGESQQFSVDSPPNLTEKQVKALYRKVDWRYRSFLAEKSPLG